MKKEDISEERKKEIEMEEDNDGNFFKVAFTEYLPVALSVIGLFLFFIAVFVGLVGSPVGMRWVAYVAFGSVLTGTVILLMRFVVKKKFELSAEFVFTIVSLVIVSLFFAI